jgi:hypothetical protein
MVGGGSSGGGAVSAWQGCGVVGESVKVSVGGEIRRDG